MKTNNTNIKAASDIQIIEDCFLWNKKYFLVSVENDKCVKLSRNQSLILKMILPYLDGNRNKQNIEEEILSAYGISYNLDNVIKMLSKYHFMYGDKDHNCKIEMELYGEKIKKISLERINKIKINRMVSILIFLLFNIIIAFSLVLYMIAKYKGYNAELAGINWKQLNLQSYIYIVCISAISLILHETGHIISAVVNGVPLKSFNFLLRYGVNPCFYVQYENMYLLSSYVKLKIIISGMYTNLILVCFFYILYYFYNQWIFMASVMTNLLMIINNFNPLSYSDGYVVFTIISGEEGFRWKILNMYKSFINRDMMLRKIFSAENAKYILYILVCLPLSIISFIRFMKGTLSFFEVEVSIKWVGYFVIIFFAGRIAFYIAMFTKKVKMMT